MKKIFAYVLTTLVGLLVVNSALATGNEGRCHKKFVDFKGYQIYYEVHGDMNVSGTLVFIHGWSGNLEVWTNQLNAFTDYRVVAIDLPGHGRSSKEVDRDYSVELFVNAINAVLINEKVDKAFVFGHSLGFAVAEIFALKYPQKTVGIASIDGAHFEVESDEKSQTDWIAGNTLFAESMNEEAGRTAFINMLFLPDTPEDFKNEILESVRITPLPIGKKVISSMSHDMRYWEKRVVTIPCFVIHSPVYQLTNDYKIAFKKMYPSAEYHEIDGVSHFLMLEIPEVLNQLIARYLTKMNFEVSGRLNTMFPKRRTKFEKLISIE